MTTDERAARRVYKYPLLLAAGPQQVEMPIVATVLHVHEQNDRPVLWAEVNTSARLTTRTFAVFATGEDVPVGWRYVGTVHVGWTTWHVFEEPDRG